MHCAEAVCHPIVSQAQARVGLFVLQRTQQPLCPLHILRAAVNTCAQASSSAAEFTRKGIVDSTPSQAHASLWECPRLFDIPPPTRPRKTSK